jgi:sirohydrochlorin ferrochelatase
MRALLIVAHGSRRANSNDEVRALVDAVAARDDGLYDRVSCAFLELAEPSIPDGIKALMDEGVSDITVVPYFLSAGRHVVEDIPAEVAKAGPLPPEVKVRIAPYIGLADSMADLLLAQGRTTV